MLKKQISFTEVTQLDPDRVAFLERVALAVQIARAENESKSASNPKQTDRMPLRFVYDGGSMEDVPINLVEGFPHEEKLTPEQIATLAANRRHHRIAASQSTAPKNK